MILFQGLKDQDLFGGLEGRSKRVISWAMLRWQRVVRDFLQLEGRLDIEFLWLIDRFWT